MLWSLTLLDHVDPMDWADPRRVRGEPDLNGMFGHEVSSFGCKTQWAQAKRSGSEFS
jgi:hypothetical protein